MRIEGDIYIIWRLAELLDQAEDMQKAREHATYTHTHTYIMSVAALLIKCFIAGGAYIWPR